MAYKLGYKHQLKYGTKKKIEIEIAPPKGEEMLTMECITMDWETVMIKYSCEYPIMDEEPELSPKMKIVLRMLRERIRYNKKLNN